MAKCRRVFLNQWTSRIGNPDLRQLVAQLFLYGLGSEVSAIKYSGPRRVELRHSIVPLQIARAFECTEARVLDDSPKGDARLLSVVVLSQAKSRPCAVPY